MVQELVTIQQKLKAPKGQYNNFGKYKYRSCEDILESVKPILTECECSLVITDDVVQVGNVSTSKQRQPLPTVRENKFRHRRWLVRMRY